MLREAEDQVLPANGESEWTFSGECSGSRPLGLLSWGLGLEADRCTVNEPTAGGCPPARIAGRWRVGGVSSATGTGSDAQAAIHRRCPVERSRVGHGRFEGGVLDTGPPVVEKTVRWRPYVWFETALRCCDNRTVRYSYAYCADYTKS